MKKKPIIAVYVKDIVLIIIFFTKSIDYAKIMLSQKK